MISVNLRDPNLIINKKLPSFCKENCPFLLLDADKSLSIESSDRCVHEESCEKELRNLQLIRKEFGNPPIAACHRCKYRMFCDYSSNSCRRLNS